MGKSDAPAPPDPKETSAAQTGTSVATSIANSILGNVNRVGADGSTLTYGQSGNYTFTDPYTGKSYDLPTFTATENLSPEAQAIFNDNQAAKGNLAGTAKDQSAFLRDYLGTPWEADTSAIESRLFDLGSRTLDPKFAQQQEALRGQLANQGISMGSEAYKRAMDEQGQTQNSAYSDLALRGRGQAFSELLSQRNQPINEITALLSGSQVSQPGYQINQPSPIPTTDNAGLINQNYNQQLSGWQQQQAQKQSLLGGLFGLGAGALSGGYL